MLSTNVVTVTEGNPALFHNIIMRPLYPSVRKYKMMINYSPKAMLRFRRIMEILYGANKTGAKTVFTLSSIGLTPLKVNRFG